MRNSSPTIAESLSEFVMRLDYASIPAAIRAHLTTAQGIVYSTAAGNRLFTTADLWTKRLEAGWPGVGAITAAMRAGRVVVRCAVENEEANE